ncbi:SDR family oxidoreductase [bacterium]|nr:SDR family oxidoreductase [bacterium]
MYEELKIKESVIKQFDLTGKVAVITGGAGFLGLQFAEAIAEMGGVPILFDLDKKKLELAGESLSKSGFSNFYAYVVDITNEESIYIATEKVLKENSRIDILINSAALTLAGMKNNNSYFNSFEETDENIWEAGLKVNLTSIQIICKVIGSKMVKQGNGNIINIASDIGVISPNQNIYKSDSHGYDGVDFNSPAFYSVSKAGVIHLTKYLATYWGKNNVRVNSISPTGVYRGYPPAFVKKLSEQIPMGRMALPNEFKGAVVFLASDASSFITGHNLIIDGGRTIW